ncbi:MAG: ATP synthase subunit delta [Candidatus Magasanikbacteria bacterium GW2011_GWC2_41_17]|uniref:ATP synthase subunit delta n=2 Tax=Candidatus Magasanikiibacteriota TaxID=1752731 RepID=A0A0G1A6P6_9BACT|nr:MAG: ATP synthase subunit delta [Candidatus Magasanikbacteria bacterium GW2011_GWC2_41_17]KKS56599.1 MAG: ATP synthase subunit delta [Candidatus Magasanikbacteria bacterium GW2011_GWA2_42_32]
MKKNSNKQYARALHKVTTDLTGKNLEQVLENFVLLLSRDRKLKQANNIIKEFVDYADKLAGIVKIEITIAEKISGELLEKIKKHFGDKVSAETKIDPSILGGIKIFMGDKILDASLKTQLLKFKKGLCQ